MRTVRLKWREKRKKRKDVDGNEKWRSLSQPWKLLVMSDENVENKKKDWRLKYEEET